MFRPFLFSDLRNEQETPRQQTIQYPAVASTMRYLNSRLDFEIVTTITSRIPKCHRCLPLVTVAPLGVDADYYLLRQ